MADYLKLLGQRAVPQNTRIFHIALLFEDGG